MSTTPPVKPKTITPWNYNAPIVDPRLLQALNSSGKIPITQDMLKASIDFIIWLQQSFQAGQQGGDALILEALDEGAGDSSALRDAREALDAIGAQVEHTDSIRAVRALATSQATQDSVPDLTRRIRALESIVATLSDCCSDQAKLRALSLDEQTQGETSSKTKVPISANVLASNASRQLKQAGLGDGAIWIGNNLGIPVAVLLSGGATVDDIGFVTLHITSGDIIAALGYTPAQAGAIATGPVVGSTASVTQV